MTANHPLHVPCPTCGAVVGTPCVVAVMYAPRIIDHRTGNASGGERLDGVRWVKREPHIKRLTDTSNRDTKSHG